MAQRRGPRLIAIIPLILIGVLIGVGYINREAVIDFVTGQDIVEDMLADISPRPVYPAEEAEVTDGEGEPDAPQVEPALAGVELAPDGFPVEPREHVRKYTIVSGDTLFGIAERFNLHPNTILWANTEALQDNVHLLLIGVELYILPVNGVYHSADGDETVAEIAALYGVASGDLLYSPYNRLANYDSNESPPEGLRIVVPGGRRDFITWRAPIQTGLESGDANPEGDIHPGSCRVQYSGTGGTGNYDNPLGVTGYRITNTFAGWHPGIDLAADRGTPIYASETGVVVFAGWHDGGYGELLIIDHGEGWTTYYGHMSVRYVGCGEQVSKGQYIGEMGMSGNATGIHLHWEIRENDIPLDPREFLDLVDVRDG